MTHHPDPFCRNNLGNGENSDNSKAKILHIFRLCRFALLALAVIINAGIITLFDVFAILLSDGLKLNASLVLLLFWNFIFLLPTWVIFLRVEEFRLPGTLILILTPCIILLLLSVCLHAKA